MSDKAGAAPLRPVPDDTKPSLSRSPEGRAPSLGDGLVCPNCERSSVRRSHRKGAWEFLCSLLLIYPYRCQLCFHRFLANPRTSPLKRHREFERLQVRFPASFRSTYLDQTIDGEGTVVTLSIRGCSLTTQEPLAKGMLLRLQIRNQEQRPPIEVGVAAVRSSAHEQMGIEFLHLHPAEEARLRRFLEHLLHSRFH
jgi:hypothetical protein